MRYRFIGQYTLGRTSICMNGITFEGREPSEVPAEIEFRFSDNIEFEQVTAVAPRPVAEPVEAVVTEAPKKRGRPRKGAANG